MEITDKEYNKLKNFWDTMHKAQRKWNEKNKDKLKDYQREYSKNNRERLREYHREYQKKYRKNLDNENKQAIIGE